MILGMGVSTFALLHVLVSLAGIGSGLIVVYGFLTGKKLDGWTTVFLTTTALTSLTGFLFPFERLLPSHILGAMSLAVLALAAAARYGFHMSRHWRSTYVIAASIALYFNVFVAVVQAFSKIPLLKALAPTQKEPPFLVAQLLVLATFTVLTILSVKRFRSNSADSLARAA